MNTCKTCKWWGSEMWEGSIHRSCDHPKLDQFSRPPNLTNSVPDGVESSGNDAGYVGFCPGPDFGCIHHET